MGRFGSFASILPRRSLIRYLPHRTLPRSIEDRYVLCSRGGRSRYWMIGRPGTAEPMASAAAKPGKREAPKGKARF
jgi:hypothetical protein